MTSSPIDKLLARERERRAADKLRPGVSGDDPTSSIHRGGGGEPPKPMDETTDADSRFPPPLPEGYLAWQESRSKGLHSDVTFFGLYGEFTEVERHFIMTIFHHAVDGGSLWTICTPDCMIEVKGRNIGNLSWLIKQQQIFRVFQFDPDRDVLPSDGQPIVTHINITRRGESYQPSHAQQD